MIMNEDIQHFIEWAKLKIRIHIAPYHRKYFKEREIWWCSLGKNIGYEQDGKNERFERPILIVKKFNHEILWTLPLTRTSKENNKYYFKLEQYGESSFIVLSQLRLVSSKRLLRKMRMIREDEFGAVKICMRELFA